MGHGEPTCTFKLNSGCSYHKPGDDLGDVDTNPPNFNITGSLFVLFHISHVHCIGKWEIHLEAGEMLKELLSQTLRQLHSIKVHKYNRSDNNYMSTDKDGSV